MADRGIAALMCGVEYHGANLIIMLRQRSTSFIPQCWVTIKRIRSGYRKKLGPMQLAADLARTPYMLFVSASGSTSTNRVLRN